MSKNYQIKYSIKTDDLTAAGVNKAIANLKKLADAQKKLDKERIESRHKVLAKIYAEKQSKQNEQFAKKEGVADLARYRQLLGRKALMEKVHALRKLKGDEDGLKKYRRTQQSILTSLQNKFFEKGDYKGKAGNLAQQLVVQGRLNRSEFMLGSAIDANNRKRQQTLRLQERQAKQAVRLQQRMREERRSQIMAAGAVSAGALYAGKNLASKAIDSSTTQEMMGLSLRALEGNVAGNRMKKNIELYATTTGFRVEEVSNLYKSLITANKTGRLKFSKNDEERVAQMDQLSRVIGNPILAFANKTEDRGEIIYQLQNALGKGYADLRQDFRVITGRGLVMLESEVQKITGKPVQGNGPIPLDILMKAWINLSKSPEIEKLMREKSFSLTQALDTVGETSYLTAGSFGLLFARATQLPNALNKISGYLLDVRKKLDGVNESADMSGRESLDFGQQSLVASLKIGTLTLGLLALAGAYKAIGKFVGFGLLTKFLGIAGGISLIFADWKGLFDDINKQGLSGVLKHIDMIVSALAVLGGGFAAGGLAGMAVAAIGITGYAGMKLISHGVDKYNENAWNKEINRLNAKNPNMTSIPNNMTPVPSNSGQFTPQAPTNIVNVHNTIEASTGKTKTKVDVYSNPLFGGAWAN